MPSVILLDVAGVIVGTLAGCAMKKHISGSLNESINLALSVISAAVGVGPVSYTHLDVYKRQVGAPLRIRF